MKPTIGKMVVYRTTQADREMMKRSEQKCIVQEKLPAVVISVKDDETVNLRVFCDGDITLHKTDAVRGAKEGGWVYRLNEKE